MIKLKQRAMSALLPVALMLLAQGPSQAADMPQRWLDKHAAGQAVPSLVEPDQPECTDFSLPGSRCCAVVRHMTLRQQLAFIALHPGCDTTPDGHDGDGNGGNGNGGNNGGGNGNGGNNGGGNNGGGNNGGGSSGGGHGGGNNGGGSGGDN